jgi:hypothetical protein
VDYIINIEKNSLQAFKTISIKFDDIFLKLVDMADPVGDPLSPYL